MSANSIVRFKILRGTTAQRLSFTPLDGELVQDTTTKFLYIGDGVTVGGVLAAPLAAVSNKLAIVVRNQTGVSLLKGTPVVIIGHTGSVPLVDKADAASAPVSDVLGLLENDLPNNTTQTCVIAGEISNIDMSAYTSGDQIYLKAGGGFTNIKPVEPNFIVTIGNVELATAAGSLLVHINDLVDLPNLPANNVPIGVLGGNTTTTHLFNAIRGTLLTGLSLVTGGVISATDSILVAFGKVQKQISDNLATLSGHIADTGNPHATTKAQVGLGNVDNTSDVNKPVSTAQAAADAADRAFSIQRANHTGTQLAATISDFADSVLSTVLTGLSLATGTAITAADTVLSALGKLQKQISDNLTTLSSHIANVSNPHATTKAQVGLSAVPNIDTSTTSNITEGSNLFFTTARVLATVLSGLSITGGAVVSTDTILAAFGKLQNQINNIPTAVLSTVLTGYSIGANTAIAATDTILQAFGKTQGQLNAKEPTITGTTSADYYRGDKTFQTLNKAAVGLGSVDNTADAAKNVLNATKLTTARNINGVPFDGTAAITVADATKEPLITGTTSADFWSGAKTFINFASTVLSTVLTGFVASTNTVVAATDTVLQALQKLQAQVTARVLSSRLISTGTGLSGGGDLTADRTISLANTAVTAGSYGLVASVAQFTVDAQGRITTAVNVAISIVSTAVSDFAAGVRSVVLTGLSITGGAITAADTVLSALGKLQSQINAIPVVVVGGTTVTEQTASVASTAVADTTISAFNVTAPATGTYLAIISARIESTGSNSIGTARMFSNGVAQTSTIRTFGAGGVTTNLEAIEMMKVVSLTAGQTLDMRWSHSAVGFNILDRQIVLLRLT